MHLIIEHNFGRMVLSNVVIKDGIATGTVVSGHSTNRLLHHTSTTHLVPGEKESYPIYNKLPIKQADGTYFINCQTCG